MKKIYQQMISVSKKLKFETLFITLMIIISTFIISNRLNSVRETISDAKMAKLYVVDDDEVEKLCQSFQKQWGFKSNK